MYFIKDYISKANFAKSLGESFSDPVPGREVIPDHNKEALGYALIGSATGAGAQQAAISSGNKKYQDKLKRHVQALVDSKIDTNYEPGDILNERELKNITKELRKAARTRGSKLRLAAAGGGLAGALVKLNNITKGDS